jgi:membrane-associated phospholipid phosphatase
VIRRLSTRDDPPHPQDRHCRPVWRVNAPLPAGGLSFPSGHTSDGALAAALIAWLVVRRFAGRVTPWVVWLLAVAYALLIAWTRVYLGVHWPTDVLGSLAFVTAWLSGALVLQRLDESPLPATTAESAE